MELDVKAAARASSRYLVECFDAQGHLRWRDTFQNLVVTEGLNTLLGRTFDAIAADVNWFAGLIGAGAGTVSTTNADDDIVGSGTSFTAADIGSDVIVAAGGAAGADLITTVDGHTSGTAISLAANAGVTQSGLAYAIEPRQADVMNSKSFVEVTPYSNATRPAWTKNGAPAAGAMSNSVAKASFSINATSRIFGAFLTNSNTKGGTTGLLYGGGLFSGGSRPVQANDTLNIQIDLSVTAVP